MSGDFRERIANYPTIYISRYLMALSRRHESSGRNQLIILFQSQENFIIMSMRFCECSNRLNMKLEVVLCQCFFQTLQPSIRLGCRRSLPRFAHMNIVTPRCLDGIASGVRCLHRFLYTDTVTFDRHNTYACTNRKGLSFP